MKLNTRFWLSLSLINLLIVALLGTVMRYKIGFEFPYFNQKNLQHAHSHFAFLGWITHTIYVLMLHLMNEKRIALNENKYRLLLIINLSCAYGMIFSFLSGGYGPLSISISSFSILVGYVFCYNLYKDLNKLPKENHSVFWFKSALVFNILSSAGSFFLAYMMATKQFNQNWYLASVYFYLHFQYNGFFTFAGFGLLLFKLPDWLPDFKYPVSSFWLLFLACVPAYFLSTLWAGLPNWLYVLVVIAAFAQLIGWFKFILHIKRALPSKTDQFQIGFYLFLLVAIAYTLKLSLQLGSTIPALSKLAFGFRPIVIAYLHLVLLAVISVFLLCYIYTLQLIRINTVSRWALLTFVGGVFANETLLAVQGIAAFSYTKIPYGNEMLFAIALVILLGITLLLVTQYKNKTYQMS